MRLREVQEDPCRSVSMCLIPGAGWKARHGSGTTDLPRGVDACCVVIGSVLQAENGRTPEGQRRKGAGSPLESRVGVGRAGGAGRTLGRELMRQRLTRTFAAVGLVMATAVVGVLAGCSGSGSGATGDSPTDSVQAPVEKVVAVLDDLGIEHTKPVRSEVGLSGAKARFDMKINGFDAGVNVFPNKEALSDWQELSDSMGGIHVAFGNSALSLNSHEGIQDSAEIAPKIAKKIGGEARGV